MVMLRVLITGAQGQLGQALMAQQPGNIEFISCSKAELDITDISQIERIFLIKKPHVIINCAAYTAVDKAEENQEKAYLVNEQGVKNLAKVCKRNNIKVIQVSTDYVFAGDLNRAYAESDLTDPVNVYGQSKLAGEQALSTLNKNVLIIRSSWLISALGHNFFNTIFNALKQNKDLQVVNDQYGTATNATVLAGWIAAALPLFWHGKIHGVFHAAAATACSWYELATEIQRLALEKQLISAVATVSAISSAEFSAKQSYLMAPRPHRSVLASNKLMQALKVPSVSWQTMVEECFVV